MEIVPIIMSLHIKFESGISVEINYAQAPSKISCTAMIITINCSKYIWAYTYRYNNYLNTEYFT